MKTTKQAGTCESLHCISRWVDFLLSQNVSVAIFCQTEIGEIKEDGICSYQSHPENFAIRKCTHIYIYIIYYIMNLAYVKVIKHKIFLPFDRCELLVWHWRVKYAKE